MFLEILEGFGLVLLANPAFTYLLIILIITCIYNYIKKVFSKNEQKEEKRFKRTLYD